MQLYYERSCLNAVHGFTACKLAKIFCEAMVWYGTVVLCEAIWYGSAFTAQIQNCITNLACITKEKVSRYSEADAFTKDTIHGNVDDILNRKETMEIS